MQEHNPVFINKRQEQLPKIDLLQNQKDLNQNQSQNQHQHQHQEKNFGNLQQDQILNPQIQKKEIQLQVYQNLQANIQTQVLNKIIKNITDKIQIKYARQYKELLQCLTLERMQYYHLQKQFKELLESTKDKEKKFQCELQTKKYQKIFSQSFFKLQKLFQEKNVDLKTDLKKDLKIIKENAIKQSMIIKENDIKQSMTRPILTYTTQMLQNNISNLKAEIQYYENLFNKIKQYIQQQQNKSYLNLEAYFPYAIKYKLLTIYTQLNNLRKINKSQNLNDQKKIKKIDSTLNEFNINTTYRSQSQYSLQFVSRKLELINMSLETFVYNYFKAQKVKLKTKFNEVIKYLFEQNTQIYKLSQRQIVKDILFFYKKVCSFDLVCNQCKQVAKLNKQALCWDIKQIFREFNKFLQKNKQKKYLRSYSLTYKWMLEFFKCLRVNKNVKNQFNVYFKSIQTTLQDNLQYFLVKRLKNCIDIIQQERQKSQKLKRKAQKIQDLKLHYARIKQNIVKTLEDYIQIQKLVFLTNLYLKFEIEYCLSQQILKNKNKLFGVALNLENQHWNRYSKKQLLNSIQQYTLPQNIIIDIIIIDQTQKLFKKKLKTKNIYQKQNSLKIQEYYKDKIAKCQELKRNFLNKNIHIFNNPLLSYLRKNLQQQIKNKEFNCKNQIHITNAFIFQQNIQKVFKVLKISDMLPQSKFIQKQKLSLFQSFQNLSIKFQDIQEKIDLLFKDLKKTSEKDFYSKIDQNRLNQLMNDIVSYQKQYKIFFQFMSNKEEFIFNKLSLEKINQISLNQLLQKKIKELQFHFLEKKSEYQVYTNKSFKQKKNKIKIDSNFDYIFQNFKQLQTQCSFLYSCLNKLAKVSIQKYQILIQKLNLIKKNIYKVETNLKNLWERGKHFIQIKINSKQNIFKDLQFLYIEELFSEFPYLKLEFQKILLKLIKKHQQQLKQVHYISKLKKEQKEKNQVLIINRIQQILQFYLKKKHKLSEIIFKELTNLSSYFFNYD